MAELSTEFAALKVNGDVVLCYWQEILAKYARMLRFDVEADSNAVSVEKALEKPKKF